MNSCHFTLKASNPEFIAVADKPLNLGGKIERLPLNEFEKRFGFVYKEGISVDSKSKDYPFKNNITSDLSATNLQKQIEKILKVACESLVICNMGKFGHGVFTSKNIPINTVVAIYSGTVVAGYKVQDIKDEALGFYDSPMIISTKWHRGIASFMQNLPEEQKFDDPTVFSRLLNLFGQNISVDQLKLNVPFYSTKFQTSLIKKSVEVENIRREYLNYRGIPVIAMVTKRGLKAGDQLGFNYGYPYWNSRKIIPEFFDKYGRVISQDLYRRVFGRLNFDDFLYTGEYRVLINSFNQGGISILVLGDDKKLHRVSSAKLMCLLLSVNACRLELSKTTSL